MAGKKPKAVAGGTFYLFDVFYEDGSRSSNRRVPTADISPFDEQGSIRAILEAQDRKIAEQSGRPRGRIKQVVRSAG